MVHQSVTERTESAADRVRLGENVALTVHVRKRPTLSFTCDFRLFLFVRGYNDHTR